MRALWIAIALAGCVEPGDPVDVDTAPAEPVETEPGLAALEPPEGEMQGQHSLGNLADKVVAGGHFTAVSSTTLRHGAVTVNGAKLSTAAVGMQFPLKDATGLLEITHIAPPTATNVQRYRLVYRASLAAPPQVYCADGEYAVPLRGHYTGARLHDDVANTISFACPDGVAAKCIDWGYVPDLPGGSGWRYHQACTRMANADYCGDGRVFTREKTRIDIRDRAYLGAKPDILTSGLTHAPDHWPVPFEEYFFESAWRTSGAICLSRVRWASMPLDGPCPGTLPDPRPRDGYPPPAGQFCEDLFRTDPAGPPDALMYNSSMTNDLRLGRWRRPGGAQLNGEQLTLGRALWAPKAADREPFPPYGTFVSHEGFLLRNLPGSIDASSVRAVYLYDAPNGGKVLARGNETEIIAGSYVQQPTAAFEGYVFPTQPNSKFAALKIYTHTTTGDLVSATSRPGPAGDWTEGSTVGWTLSRPEGF